MSNPIPNKIQMPNLIHEAFGEWQTIKSLSAIGLAVVFAAFVWMPSFVEVDLWRQALASLLIFDIAAGAVANFSQGTNEYYRKRPRHRWWFIALHLHLPLIGLLLNEPQWPYLISWVYTIGAAIIINRVTPRSIQVFTGGLLTCLGIIGLTALPLNSLGMMVSLLFMFKVTFSFAVDHYA